MLRSLDHEVIFYGGEGSEVDAHEFVQVISAGERSACYGDYDMAREFFRHDRSDAALELFNANTIQAIRQRQQPGDFLLCSMGNYHQPVAQAMYSFPLFVVEPGVGYEGVFAQFRAFESYAWMHYIYGRMGQLDGNWYDAVIPNYFDPVEFPLQTRKDDYALFIGRIIRRKGLDVAVQVTRALGLRLVVAGQGSLKSVDESLDIDDPHVELVGSVGPQARAKLLGHARVVFAPTYYIEPFGGVAVEAQLCGTPVITTDWGAFSETVVHGVTGYRCRTFDDFVWATQHVDELDPLDCRAYAAANYSLERVQCMFEEYFARIADLARQGWYEPHPDRGDLNWLRMYHPR